MIAIAHVTGADAIGRVFEDVDPGWIAIVAAAELITYPAYVLAYRSVARHPRARDAVAADREQDRGGRIRPVRARRRVRRSTSACCESIDEDERSARVRVMALGVFEWAILAPCACITAIVLLAQGANVLPSLLWPWALAVPPCLALAVWASAPNRSEWLARVGGRRAELIVQMLEGVQGVRGMVTERTLPHASAWFGITLYWAADMCALWASLRTFGLDLDVGKLIIAYSTGYAATRRSLPLGGAGATEVLMTYALYWVRQPLAPALAAVMAYRAFNFVLVAIPALVANRQLPPMIEDLPPSG